MLMILSDRRDKYRSLYHYNVSAVDRFLKKKKTFFIIVVFGGFFCCFLCV